MTIKTAGGVILGIYLLLMAVYDIRKREIQMGISLLTLAVLAVCQICWILCGEEVWYLAFSGVTVGLFLTGLSKITRGQIGTGDGIVFIVSGTVLGFFENSILLFLSLIFAAVTGVCLILFRRVGRKDTMPFVPFIFAGYGVMCLWKLFS